MGNIRRLSRGESIVNRTWLSIATERWIIRRGIICKYVLHINGQHANNYEHDVGDDNDIFLKTRDSVVRALYLECES